IWRSTNGGSSWSRVYNASEPYGCMDLAIRTDKSPDTIFAACGSTFGATIYRSANGGNTWLSSFSESGMGRTTLAIAPSNEDVVYALAADTSGGTYSGGMRAVYRTTNGGSSWTARVRNTDSDKLNRVLLTNPVYAFFSDCGYGPDDVFYNQGWYDNIIAVDPTDENVVWAGGIDLFRSNNGGQDWDLGSYWWGNKSHPLYVHADQHIITFHPNYNGTTNTTMFVGNDGGIFRTDNARDNLFGGMPNLCNPSGLNTAGRVNWTDLNNGYAVTQFYHGLPYPNGETYFGGTQDNGTNRGNDTDGANAWHEIMGGDGGYVAVDPTNTNVLFAETTGLSLARSTNGGTTFSGTTFGISESSGNFLFINPFVMDPGNPQILWTGGRFLWRSTDQGSNWVQASGLNPSGSFSAHAVAPTDSNYVVSGTSNGYLVRSQTALSTNSSTFWPSSRPARGYVSWVTFDPTNKNIVYATYSTFGVDHVWKSSNRGATWTAVDNRGAANGIPDIPVHTIAVDPTDTDRLYVGTDLGIFISTDGGDNWSVANNGFAHVVTEALAVTKVSSSPAAYQLFAFTHGRGVYRIDLPVNVGGGDDTPTPTATHTATATATHTPTATPTITPSPTPTATSEPTVVEYQMFLPFISAIGD
ncbi:MAG: hypothetical protein KC419_00430, partial [Anaerolineales bacterium]|nr:hypothetical protein [Anaerolineales bacterium]